MTALAHDPTDTVDLPATRLAEVSRLSSTPDARSVEIAKAERLAAAQQRRAAARTRDLTALLRERPDLSGVHAPADFAVEAVRWCA